MTVRTRTALYMPNLKRRSMAYSRGGSRILPGPSKGPGSGPPPAEKGTYIVTDLGDNIVTDALDQLVV